MTFVQLKPFLKNPIGIFPVGKKSRGKKFPSGEMGKISHGKNFPREKINIEIYV